MFLSMGRGGGAGCLKVHKEKINPLAMVFFRTKRKSEDVKSRYVPQ